MGVEGLWFTHGAVYKVAYPGRFRRENDVLVPFLCPTLEVH
jgi:hypothetical protein